MSFKAYCHNASKLLEETACHISPELIESAIAASAGALLSNKSLLVCGNGGSASDAMHITGELVGRFLKERRAFRAICLSSNPSILTAWSNDYSYDTVFSRQVEAYGEPGAVLLGLSTSGNSKNVVLAFEAAKRLGMTTIGMTGQGGGRMASVTDILLDVPSRHTPEIQQVHLCLYHYYCQELESRCAN